MTERTKKIFSKVKIDFKARWSEIFCLKISKIAKATIMILKKAYK